MVEIFQDYVAVPGMITSLIQHDLSLDEKGANKMRWKSRAWGLKINSTDKEEGNTAFDDAVELLMKPVSYSYWS